MEEGGGATGATTASIDSCSEGEPLTGCRVWCGVGYAQAPHGESPPERAKAELASRHRCLNKCKD